MHHGAGCTLSEVRPFSPSSPIVDLRYVFKLLRVENDLSAVAVVIDKIAIIDR